MSKVAIRKAKLHADLIASAENRIASHGVNQLNARDLAKDAGCSVGAIYNVFEDLDALILQVSLNTLLKIDGVMKRSAEKTKHDLPSDALVDLAHTYCDFVVANTNLWRTLFDHSLPAERKVPEWIIDKQVDLLDHIKRPLEELLPHTPAEQMLKTAQLLFSAVHGVINLAVDQRTTGLPLRDVKGELEFLVGMFVRGVQNG